MAPGRASHDPPLLSACPFARALALLVALVRARGKHGREPRIIIVLPPPVLLDCEGCACGLNARCTNQLLPAVTTAAHRTLGLRGTPLDVFGDVAARVKRERFACSLLAPLPVAEHCALFACDGVHPSRDGHQRLAEAVGRALVRIWDLEHGTAGHELLLSRRRRAGATVELVLTRQA